MHGYQHGVDIRFHFLLVVSLAMAAMCSISVRQMGDAHPEAVYLWQHVWHPDTCMRAAARLHHHTMYWLAAVTTITQEAEGWRHKLLVLSFRQNGRASSMSRRLALQPVSRLRIIISSSCSSSSMKPYSRAVFNAVLLPVLAAINPHCVLSTHASVASRCMC